VEDLRFGRLLRLLRLRQARRQTDVAEAAGLSQAQVSRLEAGRLEGVPLRSVRTLARVLGADVVVTLRWRGGDLDRLADEGHAALVGATIRILEAAGWIVQPEVSYSVFGERGSIDIVAWHPRARALLIVEVKTELTSIEETLRRHDAKVRLAPDIARERFGWDAAVVARLLVLPDTTTARRRVRRHELILGRAYPSRGRLVRRWLRNPTGSLDGLLFVADIRRVNGSAAPVRRVRVRTAGPRTGRRDGLSTDRS
jgi:transcriptional regulator with XRE-family HTH domain